MNANDVLKMIDAGFTADEIRKMSASPEEGSSLSPKEQKDAAALSAAAPEAPAEEKKEEKKEQEPKNEKQEKAEEKPDPVKAALDAVSTKYGQLFDKLAKMAGMPSMADIKPLGVEDIFSNFFKEE